MTQEKYDIFISYRRDGGFETAKHLYDLLSQNGYYVSFDIHTLRSGDFNVELLRRVEQCKDFILILNQGAFDRTIDPNFDPQKDWLRQELAYALQLGKNVIPIMLSGFTEFPNNLPADVANVQWRNGPKYDRYYFDNFYQRLVNDFITAKPMQFTRATGTLLINTDLDCRIFNNGEEIGEAKVGYTKFELPLGDNDLKFVGFESEKDCYDVTITIHESHQKLVHVKLLDKYNTRKAKEDAKRRAKENAIRLAKEEEARKTEQARIETEKNSSSEVESKPGIDWDWVNICIFFGSLGLGLLAIVLGVIPGLRTIAEICIYVAAGGFGISSLPFFLKKE